MVKFISGAISLGIFLLLINLEDIPLDFRTTIGSIFSYLGGVGIYIGLNAFKKKIKHRP